MSSPHDYFSRLLPQIAELSRSAMLSRLGFVHAPLHRHLSEIFTKPYGQHGSLLASPTFEVVYGWTQSKHRMDDLAGDLLTQTLVDAMDNPPEQVDERCPERNVQRRRESHPYRFGRDRHPYQHQIEAWNILSREPAQSLVVASGTGSGKTECFMVPILDRLVRELEMSSGQLTGVRALFLYPLNALINSQRERLRAWTDFTQGGIRFCLYNGNTPNKPAARAKNVPRNEVMDRGTLRTSPPPILVTNATMLEYILVRSADAPILELSQGKLEWVVLDEAHTYIGSQAAELALLIRRVLHAFGVKASQVRFVATSATIGDPEGEAGRRLKTFLAQVAGVDEDRVHLVAGRRETQDLPTPDSHDHPVTSIDNLLTLNSDAGPHDRAPERYAVLTRHRMARALRQRFIDNDVRNREQGGNGMVATLDEICHTLYGSAEICTRNKQDQALKWLDLLSGTRDAEGRSFLPLRAHLFHQTISGLWACADSTCSKRSGTALDDPTWPYGRIYLEPRKHCECGAPIYELVACDDCGAPFLMASDRNGRLLQTLQPNALDEFELENEPESEYSEEDEHEGDDLDVAYGAIPTLIVNRPGLEMTGTEIIDRQTRQYADREVDGVTLRLILESEDDLGGLICPCCGGKSAPGRRRLFQEARIGAPFALSYLLPNLLEYAPDEDCKPVELPYRGRRLLTFNDSRQGTARMAARLQQESERNRVRGLVYHLTLREGQFQSGVEIDNLRQENADNRTLLKEVTTDHGRAIIEKRIKAKEQRIAQLTRPTPIPFDDLVNHLASSGQDFDRMLTHYRDDISRPSFSGEIGPRALAQLFLIREFGRRPKRLNNLETMGLVAVAYPGLEKVQKTHPPFTLEEWRDFLKIALDLFVRNGGSLAIDETSRHWLGTHFPQNRIIGPDRTEKPLRARRWPVAVIHWKSGKRHPNLRSTLVRLLAYVLKTDLDTAYGEDLINDVLRAAWKALTEEARILESDAVGRRLPLSSLAFTPMASGWVCPVTRRILDTTLRGITPYLPMQANAKTAECHPVDFPLYDRPFGGDLDPMDQITRARKWITEQTQFTQLRELGLWDPLNDRAIELAPYFTAAEHSAQQESHRLQRYEDAFKRGDLNLLSCSTTMEMGIDIGGIAMVAMNNVPPHPANYLQRAGRAGRRQEARSLAFTLCKSNPHDQIVFSGTDWPFITPLPSPVISLNSAVIVQRHLNALALASFLKKTTAGTGLDTTKLNSEGFFTTEGDSLPAVERFIDEYRAVQSTDPRLEDGLRYLTRHTPFDGVPLSRLRYRIAEAMKEVWERWRDEWNVTCRQVEITGPDDNPAHTAALIQQRRIADEYLLRELADQGFLPAYGFPTHIAAFDNLTAQQLRHSKIKRIQSEKKGREDNRFRYRELASRDSITAIREYAPGAEVVMDGLVYRSAGITLNWKIPASAAAEEEPQSIRHAWRCSCGATGSARVFEQNLHCDSCGRVIDENNQRKFIEPAGYSVDFYDDPHNNVSTQDFIPVEPAWISASGPWVLLPNPRLGRFRTTTRGHIFHHSRGLHGQGYSLCLACGRAEPQLETKGIPKRFQKPHNRLRGDRKGKENEHCPGSDSGYLINQDLNFGVEDHTDVLELQIANEYGIWLNDKVTATSLAVALRDALAKLLGVRADELGCAAKPLRESGELPRWSIFVFDHSAAGYASSADRLVEPLLKEARKRLECPSNCDSACPHCILDFDQRFEAEHLDRYKALEFLTESWLLALRLPDELAFFGSLSRPEYSSLETAVLREAQHPGCEYVRLYAQCDTSDLGPSPFRQIAYRLAGISDLEYRVQLVIEGSGLTAMDDDDRYLLASLAEARSTEVFRVEDLPRCGNGWILAEVSRKDDTIAWGIPDEFGLKADETWGCGQFLTRGSSPSDLAPEITLLPASSIRPVSKETGEREVEIQNELDGTVQKFGERFWNLLIEKHAVTRALLDDKIVELASLNYHDRYLKAPQPVGLLLSVIKELRSRVGEMRWGIDEVTITTTSYTTNNSRRRIPHLVWSDWLDSQDRDSAVIKGFDYLGIKAKVVSMQRSETRHGRILELHWSNGKIQIIRLDQGFGYWHAPHGQMSEFVFSAGVEDQGQALATLCGSVEGLNYPTQLFLAVRPGGAHPENAE
ncbi:MAG: DEAD/DEAH box helicase [Candidatus Thiodiazotropha endolucinida]